MRIVCQGGTQMVCNLLLWILVEALNYEGKPGLWHLLAIVHQHYGQDLTVLLKPVELFKLLFEIDRFGVICGY